jgi:hypothetical protein
LFLHLSWPIRATETLVFIFFLTRTVDPGAFTVDCNIFINVVESDLNGRSMVRHINILVRWESWLKEKVATEKNESENDGSKNKRSKSNTESRWGAKHWFNKNILIILDNLRILQVYLLKRKMVKIQALRL